MPDRMKIRDGVIVGAAPSEAELTAMAEDGVQTVISLRTDGEDMQAMTVEQEYDLVRAQGMRFAHVPVSMDNAGPETVDQFREELSRAPQPVFVHCKLGKRSGAFVMMDHAVREGWTGQDTLDEAKRMGFRCDSAELERFVKQYVDERAGAPSQ